MLTYLEGCVRDEPNNYSYQANLATAYIDARLQSWYYQRQDNLYYATEKRHLTEALLFIEKAESLNVQDVNTVQYIQQGNRIQFLKICNKSIKYLKGKVIRAKSDDLTLTKTFG